jgi:hypothetical protein
MPTTVAVIDPPKTISTTNVLALSPFATLRASSRGRPIRAAALGEAEISRSGSPGSPLTTRTWTSRRGDRGLVFNFARTLELIYLNLDLAPRATVMRSKNPALARHPGNPRAALHSARTPALRRTKVVIRGASCNQGSASITAMSPSPSLSK